MTGLGRTTKKGMRQSTTKNEQLKNTKERHKDNNAILLNRKTQKGQNGAKRETRGVKCHGTKSNIAIVLQGRKNARNKARDGTWKMLSIAPIKHKHGWRSATCTTYRKLVTEVGGVLILILGKRKRR